MHSSILSVEEASLNAWPARHFWVDEGWFIRFNDGYTRRSNSVSPIYTVPEAAWLDNPQILHERIRRIAATYHDKGQPAVFKVTPLVQPTDLDQVLAEAGYRKEGASGVRVLRLSEFVASAHGKPEFETVADASFSRAWLTNFMSFNQIPHESTGILQRTLELILPARTFITMMAEGQPVSCGLAVCQNGFLGFYDIVTAPEARRNGFGQALMEELLLWGRAQNAHTAYLQVEDRNISAHRLYDKLGFREIYKYWYRTLPLGD